MLIAQSGHIVFILERKATDVEKGRQEIQVGSVLNWEITEEASERHANWPMDAFHEELGTVVKYRLLLRVGGGLWVVTVSVSACAYVFLHICLPETSG